MENVGVKDNYILVQRLKSAGCFIVCVLLALICLVPLYIMIINPRGRCSACSTVAVPAGR